MKTVARRFVPILLLTACLWAVAVLDHLLSLELVDYGVRPRTLTGLPGILFAPFIHLNFAHLVSNTVPLVVLGSLVLLSGRAARFWVVTAIILVVGYFLIWLFGRGPDYIHVGASGLIFGFFGYLIARGLIERSRVSIVVALLTVLLYGGLFYALLRIDLEISIEGHIFGFLAGVLAAWLTVRKGRHAPASEP